MLQDIGNPETTSPDDSLSSYMDDFNTPKQDMHADENAGLEDLENDLQEAPEDDIEKMDVRATSAAAKASGKMLTTVIDTTIPQTLAFIAKGDVQPYKATDSERAELEAALTEYMRIKGSDIPPSMLVLILVVTIYGTKLPAAIEQRKLNEREQQLNAREQQLKQRENDLIIKAAKSETQATQA